MTAAAIPYVLMGASTALSGISSIQQGNYADRIGQRRNQTAQDNAKIVEAQGKKNVRRTLERGANEERAFRKSEKAREGTSIMNIARSGVMLEGSPLMVLNEVAAETEREARGIHSKYVTEAGDVGYNSYLKARDLRTDGAMSLAEGKYKKKQGYLQAAGTLLQGGSKMYKMSQ